MAAGSRAMSTCGRSSSAVRVLPVGLSRFAQGAGELVVNCAQGGGGKDVWVLSR